MIKVCILSNDTVHSQFIAALVPPFSDVEIYHWKSDLTDYRAGSCEIVVLDLELNNWREIIRKLRSSPDAPPVIALSPADAVRDIVQAMRAGAYNWLTKPVTFPELNRMLSDLIQHRKFRTVSEEEPDFAAFLGQSLQIREVKRLVRKYAGAPQPILLTGESGTGKGIVARIIHDLSPRQSGPFNFCNCGAIAPTLIESELFGSTKGSYTGAVDRAGYIEESTGGSFFLDEIGELPLENQGTLLKVLEEGVFFRLGSTTPVYTDTRFIAATNRKLETMVEKGGFRKDLFYRLNILPIDIPPLREHKEDIPILAAHFLRTTGRHLDIQAMDLLLEHDWPGNVRELSACLIRATLCAETDTIRSDDISF